MIRMTATATQYRLTGIVTGSGACDHCGRTLNRLFRISDGTTNMVVGRDCCKQITGWTPQLRMAEIAQKNADAQATYPALFARVQAVRENGKRLGGFGHAGMANSGWHMVRDETGPRDLAERIALAEEWITVSEKAQAEALAYRDAVQA